MERTLGIWLCAFAALVFLYAFAGSADAAISSVNIDSVTATSAIVSWKTDAKTNAIINYGLDTSFGVISDPTFANTAHSLTIPDLEPDTTYHFRVTSVDTSGNTSATGGFVFTTGIDSTSAASPSLIQKILAEIKQLKNPADFAVVDKALKAAAGAAGAGPTILGQAKVAPTTDGAEVTWTTNTPSGSVVELEPDSTYDANSSDPYSITQGDSGESTTNHDVKVIGLKSQTEYHYIVSSTDPVGLVAKTEDDTFTTKSTLPQIQKPAISNVSETVATVTWSTGDVLASGNVDFTDLRTKRTLSMGDPAFLTKHAVELTGLIFGTSYQVVIHATNKSGDEITSKPMTFTTVRDTTPPVISKVDNQSTLFPSDNVKVQTIISWETDEPAACQLFYINGIVKSADNPVSSQPAEANPLTDHTQVIVGLAPSAVYKFWVQCKDLAGNPAQSDDYVLITPTKQKNIIDLILQNFQGTFGWLNNVGK